MEHAWKKWVTGYEALDRKKHIEAKALTASEEHEYSYLRNVVSAFLGAKKTLMEDNRVRTIRVPVALPVIVQDSGMYRTAFTKNISSEGAFIEDERPARIGEKIELRIFNERNETTISVRAEVKWRSSDGMGVQFVDVDNETILKLYELYYEQLNNAVVINVGAKLHPTLDVHSMLA